MVSRSTSTLGVTNTMNLRLFSAEGANCCERVRWALGYKRLPYALLDPDADEQQAQFARVSPFGRVPVLLASGLALSESMAIAEYIEELAPNPALLGRARNERARIREVCEAVNSSIHPVQNSSVVHYFRPDWSKAQMRPVRASWIEKNLKNLEAKLWLSGNFVVGESFSLADIFVAVIYRKAASLGTAQEALPRFEAHWQHLMAVSEIVSSCPIARQQ